MTPVWHGPGWLVPLVNTYNSWLLARWRAVSVISTITSCSTTPFEPAMCVGVSNQNSSHTQLSTQSSRWKWSQQRRHYKVLGFQLISATAGSSFLFDAAGRPGVVRHACPRLCQIKGQRLDGEASPLFIPVQPRERPNKSGGNVVTGESERSLPTGRGKWRESLSLNLPGYVYFFLFFLNS